MKKTPVRETYVSAISDGRKICNAWQETSTPNITPADRSKERVTYRCPIYTGTVFFNLYTEGHLTHENRWRAQQECKRGGNKYGKPTECCGDTFPDVMPLQQVSLTPCVISFLLITYLG